MENTNIEVNQNKTIDLTKGIYIPSIECNWLYKAHKDTEDHNYIVEEKYLDKLLNGKIDWSFELMENDILTNNINIVEVKNDKGEATKLYTLDIVNVRYNNRYKTKAETMTTKRLRDWSYINGFTFNGNKMTNFKRSSGKARVGENLFLLDSICSDCLDWARMNLKFKDAVSIASVRAYESLPLSSAITSINIPNPHESILVIADYPSEFKLNMSQTWLEKGQLHTETKLTDECNSIWDGQGLLSKKIFDSNELTLNHGNMLLRNRLTKINGISCDLEQYYRDYCELHKDEGLDYETLQVTDIAGRKLFVKNLLLVTTPSALKIEKFNKQVLEKDGYEKYGDKAWLYYYLDNCGEKYAVCKVDKPSHYDEGNKNVLSYQMINTIPFSKLQLEKLVSKEIEYVERLKNDLNFFLQEVNKSKDIEEDLEAELLYINDDSEYIKLSNSIDVSGAFTIMSKHNSDFAKTEVFKNFRRTFIKSYISQLRQGKIRIEADYCIANGNVMEMLLATTGDFDGKTSTLKCNQIHCSRFKPHELVVGFRNPSVNESNIGTHIVVEVPEITKYFACTRNQVFFNSLNYPTLSIYQGEDFDIDSNLMTSEPCIVEPCMNLDKTINAISVNKIKESNDSNGKKVMTAQNMSDTDHIISKNYIGDVINLSQELNSKLNHYRYNNINNHLWEKLFNYTSRMSSVSACEIDKAKKIFESLNVDYEIRKIKEDYEIVDNKKVRLFDLVDNTDAVKTFFEILDLKDDIVSLQKEINAEHAEKRKPILKEIRDIRKMLEKDNDFVNEDILLLQIEIAEINEERMDEILKLKEDKYKKKVELGKLDTRRVKPYFMKFVGDNNAQKQRKIANKKHREKIDFPIVKQFCKDNDIDIIKAVKDNGRIVYNYEIVKDLKKNDKDLQKLLKPNDKVQKEWIAKGYDKTVDSPMNWLEVELDNIKDADDVPTKQVIELVKKSKKKVDKENVNKVIEIVKSLDNKIKGYRNDNEITYKERVKKIRQAKAETSKELKKMKLNKAILSGVLINGLNSIKKNKEVAETSGIESILLEILFQSYGKGLISLFNINVEKGGDSTEEKQA